MSDREHSVPSGGAEIKIREPQGPLAKAPKEVKALWGSVITARGLPAELLDLPVERTFGVGHETEVDAEGGAEQARLNEWSAMKTFCWKFLDIFSHHLFPLAKELTVAGEGASRQQEERRLNDYEIIRKKFAEMAGYILASELKDLPVVTTYVGLGSYYGRTSSGFKSNSGVVLPDGGKVESVDWQTDKLTLGVLLGDAKFERLGGRLGDFLAKHLAGKEARAETELILRLDDRSAGAEFFEVLQNIARDAARDRFSVSGSSIMGLEAEASLDNSQGEKVSAIIREAARQAIEFIKATLPPPISEAKEWNNYRDRMAIIGAEAALAWQKIEAEIYLNTWRQTDLSFGQTKEDRGRWLDRAPRVNRELSAAYDSVEKARGMFLQMAGAAEQPSQENIGTLARGILASAGRLADLQVREERRVERNPQIIKPEPADAGEIRNNHFKQIAKTDAAEWLGDLRSVLTKKEYESAATEISAIFERAGVKLE